MTELFGGLGAEFRSAYEDAWPLDAGYAVRRDVYDLYHLLNHLNLFGSAYLERCRATLACIAASL
jgi:fructosamine-3-kinase